MKFAKGVAGMNWPSVPFAAALYVRLETTVAFAPAVLLGIGAPLPSSAWIESTPFAESASEPTPYQLRTMSSRAMVAPASMLTMVCFSSVAASPFARLNDTWYLAGTEVVFAMRMSLRQLELTPGRWPTEGISIALSEGVVSDAGETGVVRLIVMGMALL